MVSENLDDLAPELSGVICGAGRDPFVGMAHVTLTILLRDAPMGREIGLIGSYFKLVPCEDPIGIYPHG